MTPGISPPGRQRFESPEPAEIPESTPRPGHSDPSQQPANAPPTPASSLALQTQENTPTPARLPRPALPIPAFPGLPQPPIILSRRPLAKAPHTHPQPDCQRPGPLPRRHPHLRRMEPQSAAGRRRRWRTHPLSRALPRRLPAPALSVRPRAEAAGELTESSSARAEPPHRPSAPPRRRGPSSSAGGARALPEAAGEGAREGSGRSREGAPPLRGSKLKQVGSPPGFGIIFLTVPSPSPLHHHHRKGGSPGGPCSCFHLMEEHREVRRRAVPTLPKITEN